MDFAVTMQAVLCLKNHLPEGAEADDVGISPTLAGGPVSHNHDPSTSAILAVVDECEIRPIPGDGPGLYLRISFIDSPMARDAYYALGSGRAELRAAFIRRAGRKHFDVSGVALCDVTP